MKKSFKFFAVAMAIGTFAVNLSMDSLGNLSFSTANADAVESTTLPKGWRLETVDCNDSKGNKIGTAKVCFGGSAVSCTPEECTTTPPETNE